MFTSNSANQVTNSLVKDAVENAYSTLNSFAGSEDFLSKIKTAFGESFDATKLENLRQQWLSGNFASLPAIEIRTGAELQGANAVYAGSTNTIYFSQDFLSKYASNPQAISAVLIEEIGHYVDWHINTDDTPGDEGEYFSNLVQGFELSSSQIQAINSENDSVVLTLDGKLVSVENSLPFKQSEVYSSVGNNPLTATEITKLLVFGTNDPSQTDYNEHIRTNNPKEDVFITYDMKDYMTNGGGQYAYPSLFPVIDKFFTRDIEPGEYSYTKIQNKLGAFLGWDGFDEKKDINITISQYKTDTGNNKYADRAFIFGTGEFKIDLTDAIFYVSESGDKRIDNFEVRAFVDNFDFESSNPIAQQANNIFKDIFDPYNLARGTVRIKFFPNLNNPTKLDESAKGEGTPYTSYSKQDYLNHQNQESKVDINGGIDIPALLDEMKKTNYLDEISKDSFLSYMRDGMNVIYGKPEENDDLDKSDYKVKVLGSGWFGLPKTEDKKLSSKRYFLVGGTGNDKLTGYLYDDELQGGKGNDKLYGGDGNDVLNGGEDKDDLYGQRGSDHLFGEGGSDYLDGGNEDDSADFLYGGSDNDILYGWGGNDDLRGEDGSDDLWGGTGEDWLYGGWDTDNSGDDVNNLYGQNDSDRLFGEDGNDYLDGGNEDNAKDYLYGGKGNDILHGWGGDDYIDGETGIDTVKYTGSPNGVVVNIDESASYSDGKNQRKLFSVDSKYNPIGYYLDLSPSFFIDAGQAQDGFGFVDDLRNIENILASPNNDVLIGNALGNKIEAFGGDDFLIGNAGNDILDGGEGVNTVSYRLDPSGVSVNLLTGQAIDGWGNTDALIGISNVVGSDSKGTGDKITGDQGSNKITGGFGNDRIDGQGGEDWLYGEFGNDILIGGLGADRIYGNQGIDIIWGDLEGNPDTGYNDYIRGGSEKDIIHSGGGDDIVWGDSGYGDDEIWGDAGNDTLYGEAGYDFISGGTGNDNILGGTEGDTIYGDAGDDKVAGDEGEDILRGGDGADEILGGDGQDFIVAESGYDTIDGGAGIDTVDYSIAPSGVLVNIDDLSYNNQANAGEFDLEVNFDIAPGTGLDGFGTVDKLISLGNIIGSAFNDTLIGNSPDNHIQAGAGDDLIISTEGKDIYDGQDGIDVISFRRDASAVYVDLKEGFANDGFQAKDSIAQIENVVGSNFNDRIYADDIANTITGGKGNDTIDGRGSSDLIYGEANNDVIYGADGEDTLYGNSGNDIIDGGAGNDTLDGAEGDDQLSGQAGNDTLDAGDGNDTLGGGDNEDILYGRTGNDSLDGGSGNDSLDAAEGDDQLFGQTGNDTLDAGDGKDTLSGGDDDDILYGRSGSDSLDGGAGNDSLDAAEGNDKLFGQTGNDTLDAGDGNDTLSGGDNEDILFGRMGNDSLDGGFGNDTLDAAEGDDQLFGQAGNDTLNAGDGNDTLSGGDGDDTLLGQTGDDTLDGGLGNDSIDAGDGKDTVTGGNDADTIVAGTGDDYIDGGEGSDRIFGDEDKDTIYGRTGDDYIDAGRGSDRIFGEEGNDTILGQTGRDSIDGGEGADTIHGGTEDDTITGNTGDDTFTGGGDRDWFIVKLGDNTDIITDFGGVGRGRSPLPEIIAEVDTIKFIGTGLSSQNMLLTQVGTDLAITFENIDNNKVILQNFALENIDNLLISKGSAVDVSNIFFDGDENLEDSDTFDVINAETQPIEVNHKDVATFLNDLDNNTKGFDNSQDIINGQGGNDTLSGLSGNDTLRGGEGNDSLLGGTGNDYLKGDAGNDILVGEKGADRLNGNAGDDSLHGGIGNDTISGDTGNDTLTGGGNQDLFVIKAGDGIDLITDFGGVGKGKTPSNQVIAEVDTLKFVGAGLIAKNMILTQEGTDLAISFDGIDNTKIILGNFTLENLDNLLTSKGASIDISNLLFDGDETIQQSDTFDIMNADEIVTLVYHKNVATFLNDLDNNTSGYSNSNDIINGQGGNDTLTGLSGDDILRGGSGDDLLNGGSGKDILNGGIGKDTFVVSLNVGEDIITDFVSGQDLVGLTGDLTFNQLTITPGTNGSEISFQNQLLASLIGVQTPLTSADFTII
ncbi:calcium-binding protein [Argonema galeatum]|uniref:calcium-binding protein n=1 Tax=Argonema galeatum TaxID=2942762 RepID=UPI0020113524|nr:calcium-binding protein [Argonema galeatum]MCL1467055.1 hypothetical protein [Argonema galeatum A003/A1]